MNLDLKTIQTYFEKYRANKNNKLVENAITKNGVYNAVYNNDVRAKHNNEFSVQTKKGGMTNQKQSGRCWIFAALNILKPVTMEKLNVESFEFSQAYTMFWEKMEKANTFLNLIIEHINLDYQDRLFETFLRFGYEDGGYWEWAEGLITKYGVVPKSLMPETFNASNTAQLNSVLQAHLMNVVKELKLIASDPKYTEKSVVIKEKALQKVFEICAKSLGLPPQKFDFEYRDKDKKFVRISNITPLEFLEKYASNNYQKLVDLYADPRDKFALNTKIQAKYFRGPIESRHLTFINVSMQDLKQATIKSLQAGQPCWFACDMGPQIDRKNGLMDTDLYNIEQAFDLENKLTKADKLNLKMSQPTHAMAFVGVDLDENNQPIKWEIENSWGEENGTKGYFSMSDDWFSEYVYSVIVAPEFLNDSNKAALDKEPIEIEPWDPLSMVS
ncbi:biotin transporter BioY [Mycoplasmopsis mucosicanis]|uniref:Aminopeptidase n=1 Tax=Mycoplasmopsis mucosicanis TaxID=458208 RepID=A0A507SHF9_9BACT|nr:C1 family peptidase [Mycoplasmopsis mucosicanis]TQC51289.1 biotin transporter BioY [Mycoplasmopsis mucosicanis]